MDVIKLKISNDLNNRKYHTKLVAINAYIISKTVLRHKNTKEQK